MRNSSVVPFSALRALGAARLERLDQRFAGLGFSCFIAEPDAGATSSSFMVIPIAIQDGIVATMLAR